jgi:hypothetical protein
MSSTITRNIQGHTVLLTLIEVEPDSLKLDPTNPRIGFSMKQLAKEARSDAASTLLLTSQEDTEGLKRSILLSGGVQEPIYVRHDYVVAEGNRRVVATRALKEEAPDDPRFARMPAWLIPKGTPESVIQDLLNEIHLGAVRGWAPYEKALQMRSLVEGGLIEEEVAERYRMTASEVRQQIQAANVMDKIYFPITSNSSDPEHRAKFSYFLEFEKNSRLKPHCEEIQDLPQRFARWVRDGRVNAGAKVRRLPKILDSPEATRLLEVVGFDAAEKYLAKHDPREHELYSLLEEARARLGEMPMGELTELAASPERIAILRALQSMLEDVFTSVSRLEGPQRSAARRTGKAAI